VRLREQAGPYEITVFTAPTPCRTGPVDVSVLIQDAVSAALVPDAQVTVTMDARGSRSHRLSQPATFAAATNKLLRAVVCDVPWPGPWDVRVLVVGPHGDAEVQFALEAAEGLPRWRTLDLWPWILAPLVVVAVFALPRLRVQRPVDSARSPCDNQPGMGKHLSLRHRPTC
jgi:hypothetical protein